MKLATVFIVLAVCFTFVKAEMKGSDLQDLMAKEHGTFIVLFYDPQADLEDGGKEDYVDRIQKQILGKPSEYKDYRFFTIDATDKDAAEFVKSANISLEKLKHHPVIAAYRNKDLIWFHGEGAVEALVKQLHTFTHEEGYQREK